MLEPYMSCRFARQFGYDQLYIGNPNLRLRFSGNLFEGPRAWYYSVAGEPELSLPFFARLPTFMPVLAFVRGTHGESGA